MRDLTEELRGLVTRMGEAERYLTLDAKRARLDELNVEMVRPDLWDDPDHAKAVTTEYGRVNDDVKLLTDLRARIDDAETLYQLALEEGDDSVAGELDVIVASLERDLEELELRSLFMGEHDERDAVCEVHAGEGGTDAQDWTEMMLRMYLRWA
jgi:peptide chain release factor 2